VGRFSESEVVTYLDQTAMALDKTHQASIIHRDLKPGNLFLTSRDDGQPRIKVLDFGVAKVLAESATASDGTRSVGTPLYMAPEQFDPDAALTGAADIYALGMIAYTLLVGRPYWAPELKKREHVVLFAMTVVQGPPEPASVRAASHGVTLPPAFDSWFARVTAPNPADRFPVATAATAALAAALALPSPRATGFSTEPSEGGLRAAPAAVSARTAVGVLTPISTAITRPDKGAPLVRLRARRNRWRMLAYLAVGVAVLGGGVWMMLLRSNAASGERALAGSATEAGASPSPASVSQVAERAPATAEPVLPPPTPPSSTALAQPAHSSRASATSIPLVTPAGDSAPAPALRVLGTSNPEKQGGSTSRKATAKPTPYSQD
jgi:serine/threonine-protein kinase